MASQWSAVMYLITPLMSPSLLHVHCTIAFLSNYDYVITGASRCRRTVFSFFPDAKRSSHTHSPLSVPAGQPTRRCAWNDYQSGFGCNGLGYV